MPPIVERARSLRRAMSYPEVLLWQRLRGAPNGIRFRRGHPIGHDYVADFYSPSAKLVIEIDGAIHEQPSAISYDQNRDAFMRSRGLNIVRIAAKDVLRDADAVAASIIALASTPLHRPADGPPPRSGED